MSDGRTNHKRDSVFAPPTAVAISAIINMDETRDLSSRTTCSLTPAATGHGRSSTRHSQPCDLDIWPFDLRINAWRTTVIEWMRVPSWVSIAQSVFLLERGHTQTHKHKVTDTTDHCTHASAAPAGV